RADAARSPPRRRHPLPVLCPGRPAPRLAVRHCRPDRAGPHPRAGRVAPRPAPPARLHRASDRRHPRLGGGLSRLQEAVMQVSLSLSPGYRLKISRASRMSQVTDQVLTALTAIGGSAAFLEVLRRWLQRRQDKRQEQLQLDVRILEEGHALRQEAYQREREALQTLAEERERRHKAELLALEIQMQAKLEALTRVNEDLTRRLEAKVKS